MAVLGKQGDLNWRLVIVLLVGSLLFGCTEGNDGIGGDGGVAGDLGGDANVPADADHRRAKVTVRIDGEGAPHIDCATTDDCLFALGYVHASYQFERMDLSRRMARCTMAAGAGQEAVAGDIGRRHYLSTADGEPLETAVWAVLDPDTRRRLEAYARGVSRWISDAAPGDEAVAPWQALDTVALFVTFVQGNGDNAHEGAFSAGQASLPPAMFEDLYTLRPSVDSPVLDLRPVAGATSPRRPPRMARLDRTAALALLRQRSTLVAGRRLRGLGIGSNNWAIAPDLTRDGRTLLANDPHGPLSNPPLSMIAHLVARDGSLEVAGATVPGLPFVVIGHNPALAWGVTVSYADLTDYYVDELSPDGRSVIFDGRAVPLIERELSFDVAGATRPTVATRRWVPHHGPVIYEDPAGSYVVSVRWVGHEPADELAGFFALQQAGTLEQARAALQQIRSFGGNVVVASRDGRIGWRVAAAIPNRPWAGPERAPWLPLPGDGSAEWRGFVDEQRHPQLWDPPAGYIATANNDLDGAMADGDPFSGDGPYLQSYAASGYRHQRINALIVAGQGEHDLGSTAALQGDTLVGLARDTVPVLLELIERHPDPLGDDAAAVVEALERWGFHCPTGLTTQQPDGPLDPDPTAIAESIGCSAFHVFFFALVQAMLLDELEHYKLQPYAPPAIDRTLYHAMVRPEVLQSGEALWDDVRTAEVETKQQIVLRALQGSAAYLVRVLGPDPDGWRWGRLHRLSLPSSSGETNATLGPFANDGGFGAVDVSGMTAGATGLMQQSGAHLRWAVALGPDGVESTYQLPGGLKPRADSPLYGHLMGRYLDNAPIRLPWSAEEVERATVDLLELTP